MTFLYRQSCLDLDFIWGFDDLAGRALPRSKRRRIMSFHQQVQKSPGALQRLIQRAHAITPDLLSAVLGLALARCARPHRLEDARRIGRLIQSEAWTDAALALVDLDRRLTIRRLAYDDGEWRCTVGTQWPVLEWLDDTAEAGHAVLPLAILSAWLEGLRMSAPSGGAGDLGPGLSIRIQ
jgi:hypothetical protein